MVGMCRQNSIYLDIIKNPYEEETTNYCGQSPYQFHHDPQEQRRSKGLSGGPTRVESQSDAIKKWLDFAALCSLQERAIET